MFFRLTAPFCLFLNLFNKTERTMLTVITILTILALLPASFGFLCSVFPENLEFLPVKW